MSKKYFIFSDVHSYYNELMNALSDQQFDIENPDHIIISLGDLCDRGPDAVQCLQFVLNLYKQNRAILIKGNHEDLMEEAICRRYFKGHDIHNCTHDTARQLTGIEDYDEALQEMRTNELWNSYIEATIDYYELENNIFVHGWIPIKYEQEELEQYKDLPKVYWPSKECYDPSWRNPIWYDSWKEARWLNGMQMWNMGIIEPDKTIWCGHFHTSWGHANLHNDGKEWLERIETYYIDPDTGKREPHVNHGPFIDNGIIAMDACTALSGLINCKILEI